MDNLDLFEAVVAYENSPTPPPSFQSQVDPPHPVVNGTNRNQWHQTVLTIS